MRPKANTSKAFIILSISLCRYMAQDFTTILKKIFQFGSK